MWSCREGRSKSYRAPHPARSRRLSSARETEALRHDVAEMTIGDSLPYTRQLCRNSKPAGRYPVQVYSVGQIAFDFG